MRRTGHHVRQRRRECDLDPNHLITESNGVATVRPTPFASPKAKLHRFDLGGRGDIDLEPVTMQTLIHSTSTEYDAEPVPRQNVSAPIPVQPRDTARDSAPASGAGGDLDDGDRVAVGIQGDGFPTCVAFGLDRPNLYISSLERRHRSLYV